MKGKIVCCGCGTLFSYGKWMDAGVLRASVNGGKNHYACKPCRDGGFDILKHAAMLTGLCAQPKEVKP